jgi:hypothetical protein
VAFVMAGCGSGSGPAADDTPKPRTAAPTATPTGKPTVPPTRLRKVGIVPWDWTKAPPSADAAAFAGRSCVDAQWPDCIEAALFATKVWSGRLVALCDFADGTGDFVLIDDRAEAEPECAGDAESYGTIGEVIAVGEVP